MPEQRITHIVFTDETGTWCQQHCPRPDAECEALAVVWNGS